jgi:hypothetical protein
MSERSEESAYGFSAKLSGEFFGAVGGFFAVLESSLDVAFPTVKYLRILLRPDALDRAQIVHALERPVRFPHLRYLVRPEAASNSPYSSDAAAACSSPQKRQRREMQEGKREWRNGAAETRSGEQGKKYVSKSMTRRN